MTFCLVACGQKKKGQPDELVDFTEIIQLIKEVTEPIVEGKDTFYLETGGHELEISDNPIFFEIKEIVLKNPFDNKFPVSFSVIYQNRLISLFEQGKFVCHTIPSMERDVAFENTINTKKIEYHWIIDGKLVGRIKEKYYFLDTNNEWIK